nr:radical SAM protein [uncultured Carboxylicivirga sp.]
MTIQWHLTDKCNYRCLHCYQEDYQDNGLSLESNIQILYRISSFIDELTQRNSNVKCHINFTGGEPFLYKYLMELMNTVVTQFHFSFGILSNGYLLPESQLKELQKLQPKFVQLSLEGGKEINDSIRGKGSFQNVQKAIKMYRKYDIPTILSFTANSKNYREYSKVVQFARKNKVKKVWTDRYLPNNDSDELELTTGQFRYLNASINDAKNSFLKGFVYNTHVSSSRALQFIESGGRPYKCSAGNTLLSVLPNGDLLPCRRLPIKLGNILKDDLLDIYYNHPVILKLRDSKQLDESCQQCLYKKDCFGGLKCLSYIKHHDFHTKDPNCYIK